MYLNGTINSTAVGCGVISAIDNSSYTRILVDSGCNLEPDGITLILSDDISVGVYIQEGSTVMEYTADLGHTIGVGVDPIYGIEEKPVEGGSIIYQAIDFADDDECALDGLTGYVELLDNFEGSISSEVFFRVKEINNFKGSTDDLVIFDGINTVGSIESTQETSVELYKSSVRGDTTFNGSYNNLIIVGIKDNVVFSDAVFNRLTVEKPIEIINRIFDGVTTIDGLSIVDTRYLSIFTPDLLEGYTVGGDLYISNEGPTVSSNLVIDLSGVVVGRDLIVDLYDLNCDISDVVVTRDMVVKVRDTNNNHNRAIFGNSTVGRNLSIEDYLSSEYTGNSVGWFEGSNVIGNAEVIGGNQTTGNGIKALLKDVTVRGLVCVKNYSTISESMMENLSAGEVDLGGTSKMRDRACYNLNCSLLSCSNEKDFEEFGEDVFTTATPSKAVGYKSNVTYYVESTAAGYEWDSFSYIVFKGAIRVNNIYHGARRITSIYMGDVKL